MSTEAIREAIQNRLRSTLDLADLECATQEGPEPNQNVGIKFIGVHPGRWRFDPLDYALHEKIEVSITISLKTTHWQQELWGEKVVGTPNGLEFIARRIIWQMHQATDIIDEANDLISGTTNKFINGAMIRVIDGGIATRRRADWWGATQSSGSEWVGMSQTLTVGGMERIQAIAELEPHT